MPEFMAELKAKFVSDARDEATRRIFADPTLKVDVDLINRINAEAAARSPSAKPAVPAKP